MNSDVLAPVSLERPTKVRYGVLAFACSLSMITYLDRVCFGSVANNIKDEFGLSETEKGWLFFAFNLAYASFEIPSGWLGDVFGPRKTLIRIVLWWSLFTALTGLVFPGFFMNWTGSTQSGLLLAFNCLFLVRFFFGMGEAGAYPNIARAFHNWFPFSERGFAKGAVWMAGRFAGGITPLVVFALLYETTSADGRTVVHWRHMFWIFGSIGAIWSFFFWIWFRDEPEQKAGVNAAELTLIRAGEVHQHATLRVPWRKIFTNPNLWALCLMYACASYGWYFNITYLPGYLKDYHGLSYKENFWQASLLSGLPLLMGSLACLVGGILSDIFIRRTGNRKWGRRLFGVLGHALCALCYFSVLLADSAWGIVLAVALAAFFNDLTMGASWASCLDIGRKYSGIVAGCMNTVGNLGGAAATILIGKIIDLASTPAKQQAAENVAGLVGCLAGPLGSAPPQWFSVAQIHQQVVEASRSGWTVNFILFGSVYLVATLLWLYFDSTKPVVPEGNDLA